MSFYDKHKPDSIQTLFNTIAKRYDRTNAVLSFNLHRRWNRELVRQTQQIQGSHALLDLCAGTGDIAFEYLKPLQIPCKAYLVDFSSEMLDCAKKKGQQLPLSHHSLEYIQADVQSLPLAASTVECATMAYGIRNVNHPSTCMQEVYRVLKPGGVFSILELTRPEHPLLRLGHQAYLRTLLPIIGKWLTSNEEAYRYLQQSIRSFIPPKEIVTLLRQSGFAQPTVTPLFGGIATIISAKKP